VGQVLDLAADLAAVLAAELVGAQVPV